ncbi:MAG: hypothetical protein ACXWQR_18685, partial [Ktedonobacterales bacterium]
GAITAAERDGVTGRMTERHPAVGRAARIASVVSSWPMRGKIVRRLLSFALWTRSVMASVANASW